MKNSRLSQMIRGIQARPSMESEGAVSSTLEEAQTTQAEAPGEEQDLKTTQVDVGERADNESAEVERKDDALFDGAETEAGKVTVAETSAAVVEQDTTGPTVSSESEDTTPPVGTPGEEAPNAEADTTTGEGEQTTVAKVVEEEDATVELVTVSAEGRYGTETVSMEGVAGAVKGFAIGTAGVLLSPLTFGLSNGAVDAGMKIKREKLGNEINALAKRIADVKNNDLKKAREEGVKIPKDVVEKYDAGTVVKSFVLGMVLPFYSTYQGHKTEELEIELAAKVAELKLEMARKGVNVSNESADEDAAAAAQAFADGAAGAAAAAAEAAHPVDEVVTLDDAEAEVAGDEAIAEAQTETESAEAAAEVYEGEEIAMESIIQGLREAQLEGGLSPQAARFFHISFESSQRRLSGETVELPSLESYGGTARRDHTTTVSMEAAEGWWQKIVAVLKATWQKVREWVVKFVKAVLDQGERYYQRADKLLAAVPKLKGNAKAAEIDLGRVAQKIAVGKEADINGLSVVANVAKAASERTQQEQQVLTSAKALIAQVAKDTTEKDSIMAYFENQQLVQLSMGMDIINKTMRSSLFSDEHKADGLVGFRTPLLPGNVSLWQNTMEFEQFNEPGHDNVRSFAQQIYVGLRGSKVTEIKDAAEFGDVSTKAKVLSIADIQRVATEVKKIIETTRAAKSKIEAEQAEFVEAATVGDDVSGFKKSALEALAKAVGKVYADGHGSIGALLKYSVSTCGAYLDYAIASAKQYEGAPAPEAAKLAAPAAA